MAIQNAGLLGAADLAVNTLAQPYTVPAGRFASYTATFCNRNAAQAKIRFALATGAAVTASQWKEYDAILPANTSVQVTGIAGPANRLSGQSDLANVSFVIEGLEEDIA